MGPIDSEAALCKRQDICADKKPSNPGTETLTLCHPARTAASVRLLDALSRTVLRQPTAGPETSVSVAALASGLYAAQWLGASGRVLMRRRVAR